MVDKIKELRVNIDGLGQLVKSLKGKKTNLQIVDMPASIDGKAKSWTMIPSEETKKCYDSLILGKAWLGKALFNLGTESPYIKDGTRKTVDDIEEVADKPTKSQKFNIAHDDADKDWTERNHIEKVDWLRQEIDGVKNAVMLVFNEDSDTVNDIPLMIKMNVNTYLSEARFHLGFELERIRETEKSPN